MSLMRLPTQSLRSWHQLVSHDSKTAAWLDFKKLCSLVFHVYVAICWYAEHDPEVIVQGIRQGANTRHSPCRKSRLARVNIQVHGLCITRAVSSTALLTVPI